MDKDLLIKLASSLNEEEFAAVVESMYPGITEGVDLEKSAEAESTEKLAELTAVYELGQIAGEAYNDEIRKIAAMFETGNEDEELNKIASEYEELGRAKARNDMILFLKAAAEEEMKDEEEKSKEEDEDEEEKKAALGRVGKALGSLLGKAQYYAGRGSEIAKGTGSSALKRLSEAAEKAKSSGGEALSKARELAGKASASATAGVKGLAEDTANLKKNFERGWEARKKAKEALRALTEASQAGSTGRAAARAANKLEKHKAEFMTALKAVGRGSVLPATGIAAGAGGYKALRNKK